MSNLGRPKKSDNLKVMTLNLEQQVIDLIDNLAQEFGVSRSEMGRGIINLALKIQGNTAYKSLIVLKEMDDGEWTGFDPELGQYACYGLGTDPEEALNHFLDEEEAFIEQLKQRNP